MRFDSGVSAGFGTTPFGTYFGAGVSSGWGLFNSTLKSTVLDTSCESCGRQRSATRLGGIAVFASYIEDGYYYVIASDAGLATCFSIRYTGPSGVFEYGLALRAEPPPPALTPAPPTTAPVPPPGAVLVNSLLRTVLPEVDQTGEYLVELIDRCCGCSTPIATITIEAPAMILTPFDADLNGAPQAWIRGQYGVLPTGQPASGSRVTIPFDKCVAVHEYDARFGTLPAAQGWIHNGAGSPSDFSLVEGGALRIQTVAASYWNKTIMLPLPALSSFMYTAVAPVIETTYATVGDGVDFAAMYGTVDDLPFRGIRMTYAEKTWYGTRLDGSASTPFKPNGEPRGWVPVAAAESADRAQAWGDGGAGQFTSPVWGTVGAAAAGEVVSSFGDSAASVTDANIRNFVASYGGRFIRAGFTAFSPVTSPALRLYLVADANASALKTARFRVRYGVATGNPYAVPVTFTDTTINFVAPNQVYPVQLALAGLTANEPFWFTVERVWDHANDNLQATVHLLQATVRSS